MISWRRGGGPRYTHACVVSSSIQGPSSPTAARFVNRKVDFGIARYRLRLASVLRWLPKQRPASPTSHGAPIAPRKGVIRTPVYLRSRLNSPMNLLRNDRRLYREKRGTSV